MPRIRFEKEAPVMKSKGILAFSFVAMGIASVAISPQSLARNTELIRGWLSDEGCARGRAESGTYTQTNGDCAKQCVAQGKKIVLIDPTRKRILIVRNQDIAKKNVGDYVEVSGVVDSDAQTIKVDSLKFLDRNHAMCGVPARKKDQAKP
jgi:hypothetical protein